MYYEIVAIYKTDGGYEAMVKTNNGNNVRLLLKPHDADSQLISVVAVNENSTEIKAAMLLKSPVNKSLCSLSVGDLLEFIA